MIQYITENVELPVLQTQKTNRWIKKVAAQYGKRTGQITYIFCSELRILEINKQYLDHNYYTDIITFDYSEGETISGDIFISTETVRTNAGEYNTSYDAEILRIIIHGILHLCGQADNTTELRLEMTGKENSALEMF